MPVRLVYSCMIAVILLAACGTPPLAAPPLTPKPVFLTYPPELRPYADQLAACGRAYPDISLFLTETVEELTPDGSTSLFLATGSAPQALGEWHATLLGQDVLVVIVNQENPMQELSTGALRLLWSGETASWAALGGADETIQVWAYPSGTGLRRHFVSAVLKGELTSSRAWLVPDPQAALEAVSADPFAISYLPASWLESATPELVEAVRPIELPTVLNEALNQPVLALTESDPQGALRTLLLCFQSNQ